MPSPMTLALSVMTIYWDLLLLLLRNRFREGLKKTIQEKPTGLLTRTWWAEEYMKNS